MPNKPSIDAIHLDLTGWSPISNANHKWIRTGPDILSLLFFDVKTTPPPCAWSNTECWLSYFTASLAEQGSAVVSVEALPIHGIPALQAIFKHRQPAVNGLSDLGILYTGIWIVPFANFSFNIQVECYESGVTGTREAVVSMMTNQGRSQEAEKGQESSILVNSMDELFEKMRQQRRRLFRTPADDEKYDSQFPDHPLSRVRGHLSYIAETIQLDESICTARVYGQDNML